MYSQRNRCSPYRHILTAVLLLGLIAGTLPALAAGGSGGGHTQAWELMLARAHAFFGQLSWGLGSVHQRAGVTMDPDGAAGGAPGTLSGPNPGEGAGMDPDGAAGPMNGAGVGMDPDGAGPVAGEGVTMDPDGAP